jgi:hypothetical protein
MPQTTRNPDPETIGNNHLGLDLLRQGLAVATFDFGDLVKRQAQTVEAEGYGTLCFITKI